MYQLIHRCDVELEDWCDGAGPVTHDDVYLLSFLQLPDRRTVIVCLVHHVFHPSVSFHDFDPLVDI